MTTRLDHALPKLAFRLTQADWLAFEQLPAELIGWEKLYAFGPPFVLAALAVAFEEVGRAILPVNPDRDVNQLLLGSMVLAVAYAITVALLTIRTRWRSARRKLPTTDTTVEGDPHGLVVAENGTTRRYGWNDLTVIETVSHLFFCPAPRDAIILPLRAFDTSETMYLYARCAREFQGSAA